MVGAPHPPTPVGMQDPGSMLRRPKKEKLMCTPETLNHYIGPRVQRTDRRGFYVGFF